MKFDEMYDINFGKLVNSLIPDSLRKKYQVDMTTPKNPKNVKKVIHKEGSHFTYHIMDDNKTVYAYMDCSRMELFLDSGITLFEDDDYHDYLLRPEYVGVARCDERDTFDLETGMKLARTRALKKYYTDRAKKLNKYIKRISEYLLKPAAKQHFHASMRLKELESDIEDSWHY